VNVCVGMGELNDQWMMSLALKLVNVCEKKGGKWLVMLMCVEKERRADAMENADD